MQSTPTSSLPSLDVSHASSLITDYYDTTGEWAGQLLLKDIQLMTLTSQDDSHVEACAAYEYSNLYTPDVAAGTDTRTFSFQLAGSDWRIVAMGGNQSCTINSQQASTPSPLPSPAPPATKQAIDMVTSYYNTKGVWAGQYVLQAVQNITFGQSIGNYIRACVAYAYASPNTPKNVAGTDVRDFGFHFTNGAWNVFSMGPSGC